MIPRSIDAFNRRVDVMYRARVLKETVTGLAKSLRVSRQTLYRILEAAEQDERVMRSVAMRASNEARKEQEEFR